MPWRSRRSAEPDSPILLTSLVLVLERIAPHLPETRQARLSRVVERLGRPPVPTGLVRELDGLVQLPRQGTRTSRLPEAASATLRAVASLALAASLPDRQVEAGLLGFRTGIPRAVGPPEARRLAEAAIELRDQAIPLRRRSIEHREELAALVTALGRELARLAAEGARVDGRVEELLQALAEASDPQALRSVREELVSRVRELARSTADLKEELAEAQRRSAELEELVDRQQEELVDVRSEAARDGLTGLCNRRTFDRALGEAIRRARSLESSLSLVILDIDHFKVVNDTWGHPAGDAVLCALTRLLEQQVREGDLVARVGGEEFGVILPGATAEVATVVADRIRQAIGATTIEEAGASIAVTVSGGVARLAEDERARALYGRADRALYRAKQEGRDRVACADRG